MSVTRLARIRGFKSFIVGRDFGDVFEDGHVYQFVNIMGEIICKDLGKHAEMEKHLYQNIETIICGGEYCLTEDEYKKYKEA
jgi:hypothetical protein